MPSSSFTRDVPPFGDRGGTGGSGPVTTLTDRFEATIIVGNTANGDPAAVQAAPFRYIADTGNGAGVLAAIAAATATTRIRVRPGTYTFAAGSFASVVSIPDQVVLEGSGLGNTRFVVADPDERAIFSLGQFAQIRDIYLQLPSPTGGAPSGDAVISLGADTLAERMFVEIGEAAESQESDSLRAGIRAFGSRGRIVNCTVLVQDPPFDSTTDPQIACFQVGPRTSGPTVTDVAIVGCMTGGYGEQLWLAGTTQRVVADIGGESQAQATIQGNDHNLRLVGSLGTAGQMRPYATIVASNDAVLALTMVEPSDANMQGYVQSFGTGNQITMIGRNTVSNDGIDESGTFDRWTGVCGGGIALVSGDNNTFIGFSTGDASSSTQDLDVSGDDNIFLGCRFGNVIDTGTGNEVAHVLAV